MSPNWRIPVLFDLISVNQKMNWPCSTRCLSSPETSRICTLQGKECIIIFIGYVFAGMQSKLMYYSWMSKELFTYNHFLLHFFIISAGFRRFWVSLKHEDLTLNNVGKMMLLRSVCWWRGLIIFLFSNEIKRNFELNILVLKQTRESRSNSGRSEKYYNILLLYKYINLILLNPFFCYTSNFWIESISLKDNKSFNAITPKELFSYVYKLIW